MAERLFSTTIGYETDGRFILDGAGAPIGTTGITDDAPIGSTYSDTVNGDRYTKVTNTSAAIDWQRLARVNELFSLVNVAFPAVTTTQVIASADVNAIRATHIKLVVTETAAPTNTRAIEIYMVHDGATDGTTDATDVDFTRYARLRMGSNITGLNFAVTVSGTGAAQVMELSVTSTAAVDVAAQIENVPIA